MLCGFRFYFCQIYFLIGWELFQLVVTCIIEINSTEESYCCVLLMCFPVVYNQTMVEFRGFYQAIL